MAKTNDTGLIQISDKEWGYRITLKIDGKRFDTTCKVDPETGNPFKTKKAARDARAARLYELKNPPKKTSKDDITFEDIWKYYQENGATTKKDATIRKQESMWRTRIQRDFGSKKINEVSSADYNNYLAKLYYQENYAYKYVEGFLKFFYLFTGIANGKDWLDDSAYNKLTRNKSTKIAMPAKKQVDNDDDNDPTIGVYTQHEIHEIAEIFKRGNCYIAFLLGYYLGVRISECFGLTWDRVDWQNGTITIDRQLTELNNSKNYALGEVKTLTSSRTIKMPETLQRELASFQREQRKRQAEAEKNGTWGNTEAIIDLFAKGNDNIVHGVDFINRKPDGKLLNPSSMKYWAKAIRAETGINFLYHSLRKTHLTMLAGLNTPVSELKFRAGHKKSSTTLAYYLKSNDVTQKILEKNINTLNCDEKFVKVIFPDGTIKAMSERKWLEFDKGSKSITSPVPHISKVIPITFDEYMAFPDKANE